MRALLIASSVIVLPFAHVLAEQGNLPAGYEMVRYEKLASASPFGLSTKVEPPSPPPESPWKDWVLVGLSRIRDEQGVERDFVVIQSRDQTQRISLYGTEQNSEGVAIVSVERSAQLGKSKVTLRKDEVPGVGVVEFNQMQIQVAPISSPIGRPGTSTGINAAKLMIPTPAGALNKQGGESRGRLRVINTH